MKIASSQRDASRWIGSVSLLLTLFLALSLSSYDPGDLGFYTTHANDPPSNYAGLLGGAIAFLVFMSFGLAGYLLPLVTLLVGVLGWMPRDTKHLLQKIGMGLLFLSITSWLLATGVLGVFPAFLDQLNLPNAGGLLGQRVSTDLLGRLVGLKGLLVLLIPAWVLCAMFLLDLRWELFRGWMRAVSAKTKAWMTRTRRVSLGSGRQETDARAERGLPRPASDPGVLWRSTQPPVVHGMPANASWKQKGKSVRAKEKEKERHAPPKKPGVFQLPTLKLLDDPREPSDKDTHEDLQQNARILEATLRDFGIEADVVEVHKGPVITRYELQPAPGVKVHRITALSDDIALAMKAASIRIVAPIPGKAAVGIEVPNMASVTVGLKELLVSDEFETSKAKLPLALGKDVSGRPIIADLADMPHLMIAGATGSGKTVCVNSIILSLLYALTPEQCKLLLVDPKMVELTNYRELPHLIGPVVTDPKKVSAALYYAVKEMEKRYRLMARVGVRNIEGFNKRPGRNVEQTWTSTEDHGDAQPEPIPATLPYLIIIVDELADLMMIAPVDIETAITRLAQLSRAVGIHMILATQRPSVDVITGVIKANFPARISFQVASKVDSRTILDANGADKLLGKGDMLFLPPGSAKLVRAQGTWIGDKEIQRVMEWIGEQETSDYDDAVFENVQKSGAEGGSLGEEDELYDQAVEIVMNTQQASASILQRRLRVGYARAARLIDMMEERGVVGAFRGSKAREILVKTPNQEG